MMRDCRAALLMLLLVTAVLISSSLAYYCSTCFDPGITPQISRSMTPNAEAAASQRSSSFEEVLAQVSGIKPVPGAASFGSGYSGYDVVLDVSLNAPERIQGAISIPFDRFMSEGSLKPISEVAKILGDAGIKETDSILVYGQCLSCGVNSAHVYWILKYLGHEKVKILDGGIDDWKAAKLPVETDPRILPKSTYTPRLRPDLLATYDYVKSGKAKIVDARPFEQYGMVSIPDSLNIPFDQILINGRIKDEAELKDRFSVLEGKLPVVVYSDTGTQGASVWLAMELMGYNASLYSMKDWLEHQPRLDIELGEIRAAPKPSPRGSPVKITAIFEEAKNATTAIVCTATINNATGSNMGRVRMKRVSGDMFSGIWNANVFPGSYSITIVASKDGVAKIFQNAMEIEITGFAKTKEK